MCDSWPLTAWMFGEASVLVSVVVWISSMRPSRPVPSASMKNAGEAEVSGLVGSVFVTGGVAKPAVLRRILAAGHADEIFEVDAALAVVVEVDLQDVGLDEDLPRGLVGLADVVADAGEISRGSRRRRRLRGCGGCRPCWFRRARIRRRATGCP